MSPSDSEEEGLDDADFDHTSDGDDEVDQDILEALEGDLAAAAAEEGTEGEDDVSSDDTDSGSDDDEPTYAALRPPPQQQAPQPEPEVRDVELDGGDAFAPPAEQSPPQESPPGRESPSPVSRSPSPAQLRKNKILSDVSWPRTYTVEAICAIPHPVPTHALASSLCMTHLLTGSDDGYIRDYDIFSAVNGKIFLTAPQRHHCGVMEGLIKAGQIRYWWENPMPPQGAPSEEPQLRPVYSLAMHSDALWALAGSDQGSINLFTVRHEPGRLCHVMTGHRGPIAGLSLQHDEKGFFSAGWDGDALQWDLNTGQCVRKLTAHGSQLTAIGVRPVQTYNDTSHWSAQPRPEPQLYVMEPTFLPTTPTPDPYSQFASASQLAQAQDDDVKSEMSYDPLFDEPDADGEPDFDDNNPAAALSAPSIPAAAPVQPSLPAPRRVSAASQPPRTAAAPKNAPPVLEESTYAAFSPDVLMTASIDGQIVLWDTRLNSPGQGVGRLWMSEKTPPWCVSACWSADGAQIYAGRRNGTIDIYDVRLTGKSGSGTPRILKTLRNPVSSGVVSCVVAFPDGRHLACASIDNIRLWNVAEAGEPDAFGKMKSGVQFKIIPGHHGGFVSQMLVDPAARFLVSASSNRGWHGESTRTVFVHEIKHAR